MKAFIQKFLFLLSFLLLGRPGPTQSSITPNSPGTITTYSRLPSTYVNGTSATTQALGYPKSVAAATDGGFYIASPDEHRVYRVRSNGQMFLIAGNLDGFSGDTGDGGPATSAL